MASSSSHPSYCQCVECMDSQYVHDQMNLALLGGVNAMAYAHHYMTHCIKTPMRVSQLLDHKWVWEIWHGHDVRFFQCMRMRKQALRRLIETCIEQGTLKPKPKRVPLEESLAIFLLVVGQGYTYPMVAERLQCSTETICNHFHYVLKAICRLGDKIIKPLDPTFEQPDQYLLSHRNTLPAFKDCIDAIDGTHIGVHIPEDEKTPWFNRKGLTTTNVLAICDFNMSIIFANVGCECSMHDARVLRDSMTDRRRNFPFSPPTKYFLADAGYPIMHGFLTPYKRTRYHLLEFRANREFRNKEEQFNYRHSSLRSIIERTFGVLKKRWRVLNNMAMVDIQTQVKIIWACIALHNFIRMFDSDDLEMLGEIPSEDDDLSSRIRPQSHTEWLDINQQGGNNMATIRDSIRDMLGN